MKDLYTVASDFVDQRILTESSKYDGGNEFNHLEQAIFASKELENSLRSLQELNPGKYERFGDTIKKIREITDEFPPMLDSLKGAMEQDDAEEGDEWWNGDEEDESEEGEEGEEGDEGDDEYDFDSEDGDEEGGEFEFEGEPEDEGGDLSPEGGEPEEGFTEDGPKFD